ncbi:MAG: winged helix-turn-helix domain-containing protein, partial [Candidatus Methanoperedens sp.]|nr:winged helix-turn-helix domain-containing protein [Candidatus Methanoperedens sp.]
KKTEEHVKESLKRKLKNTTQQNKLLYYLIEGTRGGKTRALILKFLAKKPYNANQLATILDMDYKTIRHHLKVLVKNGIITRKHNGHFNLYFLSNNIAPNLNNFDDENLKL